MRYYQVAILAVVLFINPVFAKTTIINSEEQNVLTKLEQKLRADLRAGILESDPAYAVSSRFTIIFRGEDPISVPYRVDLFVADGKIQYGMFHTTTFMNNRWDNDQNIAMIFHQEEDGKGYLYSIPSSNLGIKISTDSFLESKPPAVFMYNTAECPYNKFGPLTSSGASFIQCQSNEIPEKLILHTY